MFMLTEERKRQRQGRNETHIMKYRMLKQSSPFLFRKILKPSLPSSNSYKIKWQQFNFVCSFASYTSEVFNNKTTFLYKHQFKLLPLVATDISFLLCRRASVMIKKKKKKKRE